MEVVAAVDFTSMEQMQGRPLEEQEEAAAVLLALQPAVLMVEMVEMIFPQQREAELVG